jgi:hypothetical protein
MPEPKHLNTGDSIWIAGGFSRPITNASKNKAKFVTLEFS